MFLFFNPLGAHLKPMNCCWNKNRKPAILTLKLPGLVLHGELNQSPRNQSTEVSGKLGSHCGILWPQKI